MIKLKSSKCDEQIIVEYHAGKSNWICKDCDRSFRKSKMPMEAAPNTLIDAIDDDWTKDRKDNNLKLWNL